MCYLRAASCGGLSYFGSLLAIIGHLFDGHHLVGRVLPGVVHGPEGSMTDLPEVIKDLVRILPLKQF